MTTNIHYPELKSGWSAKRTLAAVWACIDIDRKLDRFNVVSTVGKTHTRLIRFAHAVGGMAQRMDAHKNTYVWCGGLLLPCSRFIDFSYTRQVCNIVELSRCQRAYGNNNNNSSYGNNRHSASSAGWPKPYRDPVCQPRFFRGNEKHKAVGVVSYSSGQVLFVGGAKLRGEHLGAGIVYHVSGTVRWLLLLLLLVLLCQPFVSFTYTAM